MRAVRTTSSVAYQNHYHFVTPSKYRRSIFGHADREASLLAICREIEERYELWFEQIGIDLNHVHYLIGAVPQLSESRIMQVVKSITAREMFKHHPDLKKELWGGHLWTESFFVATVGEGGNKDVIQHYIKQQGIKPTQLKLFDF